MGDGRGPQTRRHPEGPRAFARGRLEGWKQAPYLWPSFETLGANCAELLRMTVAFASEESTGACELPCGSGRYAGAAAAGSASDSARSSTGPISRLRLSAELIKPT